MKTFFTALLITLISLLFSTNFAQERSYIRGDLIIQFKHDAKIESFKESFADINLVADRLLSQRMNIWLFKYDPVNNDDVEIKFRVRNNPNVKLVQFNHFVSLRNENNVTELFPNDAMFGSQWGLHNTGQSGGTPDADIDAPEAWDISTGGVTVLGDTIVVAIIDGGCQLNHPDLNYWINYNEIPNNGIDEDGNGYVDDYRGWNAYSNSPNVPSSSHGTHVSGIAGAKGNNTIGVSGVNWNVKIMPIAGSSTLESTVVAAYSYAHELRSQYNETNGLLGAFVVSTNSSFGVDLGQPENYPIWCAMYDSMGVQGMLSCGATANANWDIDVVGDVPTACPSEYMIAVTNTTRNDLKNSGAAYGLTTIDLGAPGTTILSTDVGSSYTNKTGTSMATPMVAGSIALMFAAADSTHMLQYKNNLSTGAIIFRDILFASVDTIPALQGITVTGGRLNVFNAALTISNPVVPVELISFTANVEEGSILLEWATATETNNFGFEIERLIPQNNSEKWQSISFVSGYGTTTEQKYYSFRDEDIENGIYKYRLKQIDYNGTFEYSNIVETELNNIFQFTLEQNYPNPFNPSTKIKFQIPDQARNENMLVSLKVYDVLGNEVTTLVNEDKSAGDYEVEFDGTGLSSGMYFYQLKTGNFIQTKKMLLLK